MLKISVLITLWVFSTSVSYAQYYDDEELLEDPLVKPRIWSQLKQNPTDEYLWSRYFGKDLFDITPDEYQLYEILKNDLMNQDQGYQQELEQAKIERKIAQQAYTKNDYAAWSENISLNFGQIEVYFTEKFDAMGSEYVPYHELYPEEEYNLTKWVDEHEARLEELEEINMINNGDY
ncbi:hypothetical protein EI427_01810 [Flammeovirga pectinis]|uniref:Uncharacterized protein n=1 Tax=Flammeovirga pectinis TaxID=2494373 RepID=A0A3S9NYQ4_9BACT|nr:hypothetical protein [Flammeovirga pectinis]AZQ60995.1 hypothetical protein EI427_01810 [Flammeovirga pectinis]